MCDCVCGCILVLPEALSIQFQFTTYCILLGCGKNLIERRFIGEIAVILKIVEGKRECGGMRRNLDDRRLNTLIIIMCS